MDEIDSLPSEQRERLLHGVLVHGVTVDIINKVDDRGIDTRILDKLHANNAHACWSMRHQAIHQPPQLAMQEWHSAGVPMVLLT